MAKKKTAKATGEINLIETERGMIETLETSTEKQKKEDFLSGLGRGARRTAVAICLLAVVGALGAALSGKVDSTFNPLAAATVTTATPQLSKEYIYAGSRMLAVEDAGADGFEGDVNPRPGQAGNSTPGQSGDGIVNGGDVTQIRRFVLGLDVPDAPPNTSNEFQKADCAPLSSYGDGVIAGGDVTQVRRYALGLDLDQNNKPPAAAGPTGSGSPGNSLTMSRMTTTNSAQSSESAGSSRTVKPVIISRIGNNLTVGIELNTENGERRVNSLSFTLDFDSSLLSSPTACRPGAAKQTGNAATEVRCGAGKAAFGHLGVLVELEPNHTFAFGAQQVALIDFTIAPGATASPIFGFGDMPALRFVSDIKGEPLPTAFASSAVAATAQQSAEASEKRRAKSGKPRR